GSKVKAGAVRFAPSQPEGGPGHVHFEDKLHDSAVMVTQEGDGHFLVKVGRGGRGAPAMGVHAGCPAGPLPRSSPHGYGVCGCPRPGPGSQPLSLSPGYSVRCEYTAHREGVLREEMLLASETGDGACLKVVVQARVMGK
ncbi:CT027 protein, partial [Penelope pileata]|nr:CT027 protein [Penelope pileata]